MVIVGQLSKDLILRFVLNKFGVPKVSREVKLSELRLQNQEQVLGLITVRPTGKEVNLIS